MAEVFNVTNREEVGRGPLKRLRRAGKVPAVLYGHGEASVNLAIPAGEVNLALRHSGKVVHLKGAVTEEALIREVQWCTYGITVLHVDLVRVSDSETVDVTLPVQLKGDAAGTKQGGILNFITHEVKVNMPVASIPEAIVADISNVQLGGALHASELTLPSGAKLVSDSHAIIVNCLPPKGESDTGTAGISIEPELIRKAKEDKAAE